MRRLLVLCRKLKTGTPDGQQVHGFLMYRKQIERDLGIGVTLKQIESTGQASAAVEERRYDGVLLMAHWSDPVELVREQLSAIRRRCPRSWVGLLDWYAQSSSSHFGVLPEVDLFIKRQVLRDRALYGSEFAGGYIFADYITRTEGWDLGEWWFGSKPDMTQLNKLVVGWNLGVTPRYRTLARLSRLTRWAWRLRPIAINRRLGVQPDHTPSSWYQYHRTRAAQRLAGSLGRYKCTGFGRVSTKQYLAEMLASRIVVSPFGWGEVCFRDYEAVCSGALLVKPDMSHLETNPDIYRPYQTYVPVRWDLADLESTCEWYLQNPAEAQHIAAEGQRTLLDYFRNAEFVNDFGRCLAGVGVDAS